MRYIASAYIKRKDVRTFYIKDDTICALCGSKDGLSIDHIVDAYSFALNDLDYKCLNCSSNLQVLCSVCNSGKKIVGHIDTNQLKNNIFKCCEKGE